MQNSSRKTKVNPCKLFKIYEKKKLQNFRLFIWLRIESPSELACMQANLRVSSKPICAPKPLVFRKFSLQSYFKLYYDLFNFITESDRQKAGVDAITRYSVKDVQLLALAANINIIGHTKSNVTAAFLAKECASTFRPVSHE